MKPVIVYHEVKVGVDCPDGIAAARIAALAYGDNIELIGEVYRKPGDWIGYSIPFDPTDRKIIFVDWSGYPDGIMAAIASVATEVIILDHHKSQAKQIIDLSDRLDNVINGYIPNELGCGATAAWDYFFPERDRPWFLKYIRTRDTGIGGYWRGLLPHHEAVNGIISSMRKGKSGVEAFEVFDYLMGIEESDLDIEQGEQEVSLKNGLAWAEVNEWARSPVSICLSAKYPELYKGEVELPEVPYLKIKNPRADRHYSWVGTYLSEMNPNVEFVVVQTSKDAHTIHIRKPHSSEWDCSYVAASFGGGGHAPAAGFSV